MSEFITEEKRDKYLAEIEALRTKNRRLQRILQQEEKPWQSRAIKAENELEWLKKYQHSTFERVCKSHQEIKRIFMLFWPNKEQKFNSVMDSSWKHRGVDGAIYANLIPDAGEEPQSFSVLDYIEQWLKDNHHV